MSTHTKSSARGATSAAPIVIVVVLFLLLAMGGWMWIDMTKHDLEGKAETYVAVKNQQIGGTGPVLVPVPQTGPAPVASTGLNDTRVVECRRVASPIVIDGLPDDAAWNDAQIIDNFGQPWAVPPRPAKTKTVARLLWDDQFLYFLAVIDDTDIFADIDKHNGDLWNNDVFELFFKPSPTALGYYEFEINPKNATFECYFPSRGSGSLRRWGKAFQFHLDTKVTLRGNSTLNNHLDRDVGWIIEGRIPWGDFSPSGGKPKPGDEWRFALCRFDFSVDNDEPEMTTCAPLKQASFHRYEDYSVLKFK